MEYHEEIALKRDKQDSVINTFLTFYRERADTELYSEALVSHHDPTIRFTNSTTSVMKPLITRSEVESVHYLAQPAMGQQGLYYWLRDGVFGPYASYFASMGALYPPQDAPAALNDIETIAHMWGIPQHELVLTGHTSDEDLLAIAETSNLPLQTSEDENHFRHTYGIETITGRNINIEMRDIRGIQRTLGNLTRIENLSGAAIGFEVSFDSTTATSLSAKLEHPVLAHYPTSMSSEDASLALTDTLSVSAALLVEGLTPASKGRSGVLRKFMKEYMRLAVTLESLNQVDIEERLETAASEELRFRANLSPEREPFASQKAAQTTITQWVGPLLPSV